MLLSDPPTSTESLPGSRIRLTVKLSAEEVDAGFAQALKNLSQEIRIPGFRRGRAPVALLEAQVGPESLRKEAARVLASQCLPMAISKLDLVLLDKPLLEGPELQRGQAGRLIAILTVLPKVELPAPASLTIEEPHTEVTDDDLEKELKTQLKKLAELQPVERKVQRGDWLVGDLKLSAEGVAVERPAEELKVQLEGEDSEEELGALLKSAVGASIGDSVTSEVQLLEDSEYEELAGRVAKAELLIQGIKEEILPELTDEIATTLNSDQQVTAEAFKDSLRQKLVAEAAAEDQSELRRRALLAMMEAVEFEIPDILVDSQVERRREDMDRRLRSVGLSVRALLERSGRSEQAFLADLRPTVESDLRTELVLEALGEKLAIEPSSEEIEAEIRRAAEASGEAAEDLIKDKKVISHFKAGLIKQQALDRLVEAVGKKK